MVTPITMTTATPIIMINMPEFNHFRHEYKHQISLREDLVLSQRLKKLFPYDKYAGSDGTYQVNSLYFDTPYDSALREKIDGVNRREKFRLRYYGVDTAYVRLEKKFKVNALCGKRSVWIKRQEAEEILNGNYGFLLDSKDPFLIEFYTKLMGNGLRPKTIVCYSREAFLYSLANVRITLDRNIRTGLQCMDFLNPLSPYLKATEDITILEVKYDAFLPEIVKMAVQVPFRQASACSKYALCRRFD